jgi:D-alanine--(R)-lactate ligase
MILYGGVSEEHPVSVKSVKELSRHLDASTYDPRYVFIGQDGLWRLSNGPEETPVEGALVAPSTDRKSQGLLVLKDGGYENLPVDAAFPMLHGKYGEDGVVQGVWRCPAFRTWDAGSPRRRCVWTRR